MSEATSNDSKNDRGGEDQQKPPTNELEEAQPTLRHVKLSAGPTLKLNKPEFAGKSPWGASPSFCGKLESKSPIQMKKEWTSEIHVPSNWVVCAKDLDKVPIDFPLERTHREIHDDPAVVASRISEALKKLSIDAQYEGEKAKCTTGDCSAFRIRLYDGGSNGEPVIVELQRRQGPTRNFFKTCKAILNAAEGASISESMTKGSMPPFSRGPISGMKCLQGLSVPGTSNGGLEKACALLRGDMRDGNLLGMESLCIITDPLKSPCDQAEAACKSVILGGDRYDAREAVQSLLIKCLEERNAEPCESPVDLNEIIVHKGLIVFSNCLNLTAHHGVLRDAIENESWCCEYLIPYLLATVKRCETNCNNAHLSLVGLNWMVKVSPTALDRVMELQGLDIVRKAHEIGRARHDLLATETEQCLAALQ